MGLLQTIGIVSGNDSKASIIFEELLPSFLKVKYSSPSEYVSIYWKEYLNYSKSKDGNNNTNGKIFEYILSTLFIREKLLPLFISAKVAFVPNVIYDLMFYSPERGPICISAKTSLRERYKQADLEAIALKYVHRKSLTYLITLEEGEAKKVKEKIKKGDVIGLDNVVVATSKEFNKLILSLKKYSFSESPEVTVIEASQIITSKSIGKI